MKQVLLAGVAAIALAGCSVTTQGVTSATDSTITAFQNVCLALPSAHQDFLAVAQAFKVRQSILDGELRAYNAGIAFCSSGVVGDAASAVKTAVTYVQQIQAAKVQAGSK